MILWYFLFQKKKYISPPQNPKVCNMLSSSPEEQGKM